MIDNKTIQSLTSLIGQTTYKAHILDNKVQFNEYIVKDISISNNKIYAHYDDNSKIDIQLISISKQLATHNLRTTLQHHLNLIEDHNNQYSLIPNKKS